MNVREFLQDRFFLFDGAMGTYYQPDAERKCELANLEDKNAVLAIHRAYIKAGCNAIKTNTFGANTIALKEDFDTVKQVIEQGCLLAKEAIGEQDIFLFADIGPISSSDVSALEEYQKIIDVFLENGVENFLFETFSSTENLEECARYIKEKLPDAFLLVEFAVSPEGFTRMGFSGEDLFRHMQSLPTVDAVGFNCFSGARHLLEYMQQFDLREKWVSIMPNAGYPTVVDNRTFFQNNPDYFAAQMKQIAQCGVKILGGCCGTTPEYIRKTAEALRDLSFSDIAYRSIAKPEMTTAGASQNILMEKMEAGKKIIAVELDPPVDTDIAFFMKGAKTLKQFGVDAITIADCPIARARVDSSLLACKLKRELDLTPIPHMTCRDRNINATKALLLGLNIEGIQNLLVVTGDPVPSAERDEIKTIFSFNSALLANYISTLNQSAFHTPFQISAALNVNAKNFDAQLKRAEQKIKNGVTMFLTQPVFTEESMENIKRAKAVLPAKILGGIIPIVSHRNACFMNSEISGITVPQDIIDRYEGVSKEEANQLAVSISVETAKRISDDVDGYYLITPFKRVDIIQQIIYQLKHPE